MVAINGSANETQVGGDHYRTSYQHWDWSVDIHLGCLEYAATKYVARWKKKGGIESLKKAIHYLKKVAELHEKTPGKYRMVQSIEDELLYELSTSVFVLVNGFDNWEQQFFYTFADLHNPDFPYNAISILEEIVEDLEEAVEDVKATVKTENSKR